MIDSEKVFTDIINNVFIQFAIEVEHPKYLPDILKKVKNSTAGLYLKTDGSNLISNFKDPDSVTVHKITKEVKTLTDCCDWIFKTYTPTVNYSLASIAADETRIIINSNHGITDGGYFSYLIENMPNKSIQSFSFPKDARNELLKDQFDNYLRKNRKENGFSSKIENKLTHLTLQEFVENPDHGNLIPKPFRATIKAEELSPFIYDKSTQKVNHLTEFLWTGLCLSINAKNGKFGPIGAGSCMDFRRLLPKERINLSFGNAFTNFFLFVKDANPRMTVSEICSSFRDSFKEAKKNELFYKEFLFPSDVAYENCPISYVSNVGPMRLKSPFKDFYAQCMSTELGLRPSFLVTSYSKLKKENNMNDVVLCMRCSPFVVSRKIASDVFETFIYFLKNVNASKRSGDVLNELINFQKSLD